MDLGFNICYAVTNECGCIFPRNCLSTNCKFDALEEHMKRTEDRSHTQHPQHVVALHLSSWKSKK
ncbi:hypothetical protein JRQ81_006981 [Phrynocephalus forsythii]|uniref:Uncharacterized protein n=1 Tax=Phrynocephalus forsythii TaxID=171643 RepID=A0A9Q0XE02_9SAUR|nr:hypothetical protein JRQ81_006981 [Phrynocephalus forsythii]